MDALAALDALGDGRDRGLVPFDRSYWVVPGRLLAGLYPGHRDEVVMRRRCTALASSGIRRIISLMQPREVEAYGATLVDYASTFLTCGGDGAACERFGIDDMGVPDQATLRATLDAIDASIAAEEPVYVHCMGGLGRTGTIVGCWLARHGIASGDAVLGLITALREIPAGSRASGEPPGRSPETDEQRRLVTAYQEP